MKSIKSFDALLLAILLVIGLCYLQAELNFGLAVYFVMALAGMLLIRKVMGAQTIGEAVAWLRSHARLAFYLSFIWVVGLVQIGYAFLYGYLTLIEAIGGYFFASVVFSALVFLGYLALQLVLKVFGRTR